MARETHVGRVLVVGDGRAFAAAPLVLGLNAFIIRLLQYLQLIFIFFFGFKIGASKRRVYEANFSDVESVLLLKLNTQTTLRLVLRNTFRHEDHDLTELCSFCTSATHVCLVGH